MSVSTLPRPETTGDDYFVVADALARLKAGRPLRFPPMEIVRTVQGGVPLTFCLNMERDPIQREHRRGRFYETEELDALRPHLRPGAHVIDIGANTGNHALFYATQLSAARVIVIEPNPLAIAPLMANVVLNGLTDLIVLDHLGFGLSDVAEGGYWMKRHDRNLGSTKMKTGDGPLTVCRGDDVFECETPDLIKIDVEGMEMQVLRGLEDTIARVRPILQVEVDLTADAAFNTWCNEREYVLAATHQRSPRNRNYLLLPEKAAKA